MSFLLPIIPFAVQRFISQSAPCQSSGTVCRVSETKPRDASGRLQEVLPARSADPHCLHTSAGGSRGRGVRVNAPSLPLQTLYTVTRRTVPGIHTAPPADHWLTLDNFEDFVAKLLFLSGEPVEMEEGPGLRRNDL